MRELGVLEKRMNRGEDLLLGQIAVKLGFMSRRQLDDCVSEQEKAQHEGRPVKAIGARTAWGQTWNTEFTLAR